MKMRGSIVCIAIFCLSYVSGAPTVEESKTFFKSYNSDEGELIYAWMPFWQHEVVFAVCQGSGEDKNCKIYLESTNQDKNSAQSCDLNLTYSDTFDRNVALFNAGNSRAVLAVGDGDDKIKLISVNFKGCQIKETSVEVVKEYNEKPIMPFVFVHIITHENNYDLLLRNSTLCTDGVCKVTYDYEGNLVKAASKLPALFKGDIFQLAYANNNYAIAVGQRVLANNNRILKIYLVKDGEDQKNIPLVASIETRDGYVVLSADENKVGVCSIWDGKVVCSQTHPEGEPRTVNIEIPVNYKLSYHDSLDILNLEKGFLQLSVTEKNLVHVTHFDEAGKQGRSVQVDSKCKEYNYYLRTKLYKNANGQYCFNSFCKSASVERNHSQFSITNSCFLNTELI